jgi:gas vesicle protein
MRTEFDKFDLVDAEGEGSGEGSSGIFGMALLALALGAGTALLLAPAEGVRARRWVGGGLRDIRGGAEGALRRVQRELGRREVQRRRQRRVSALLGLAVGAGAAALLMPESGPDTRRRLVETLKRRADQASESVDRIVREPQPEPAA